MDAHIHQTNKIFANLRENCLLFIDLLMGTFYLMERSIKLTKLGELFAGRVTPKQTMMRWRRHLSCLTSSTQADHVSARLIMNMSSPVWSFFSVAEGNLRNLFSEDSERRKEKFIAHLKSHHRGEAC